MRYFEHKVVEISGEKETALEDFLMNDISVIDGFELITIIPMQKVQKNVLKMNNQPVTSFVLKMIFKKEITEAEAEKKQYLKDGKKCQA
jgi:hypothetical protein